MKKYLLFTILLIYPVLSHASEFLQQSEFDIVQSEIRYSLMNNKTASQKFQDTDSDEISYSGGTDSEGNNRYKSPGKAFLMSILIPGWGQHYTGGSTIKSLAFFGTEVASWVFYFKLHNDADDLTTVFEQFNDEHWIESRYDSMLAWTYPDRDTDPGLYPELSHHLPDTKTQQYYEMTGKYDQFSWGWNDAVLLSDNTTYEDYNSIDSFPRVNTPATVPYSANRFKYETMRNDANNKYDQARKMIYVSMLNRMISAFEAMIAAKKSNRNRNDSSLLSSLSAEVSYRSYYVRRDTPFFNLSMKF
ncbi:MAG TPA: hypothetical protein ENH23_02685 [candidate division Zixibacteria bacterium]|nr:hypothetical protein [candidate division Zixibacteria bacterium]